MAYTRSNNNRPKRSGFRPRRHHTNNNNGGGHHHSSQNSNVIDFKTFKKYQATREKYMEMARNALSNGDRIEAENYFQHADHYLRLINSAPKQYTNPQESRNSYDSQSNQEQANGAPTTEAVSQEQPANNGPAQTEQAPAASNFEAEEVVETRLPEFITN